LFFNGPYHPKPSAWFWFSRRAGPELPPQKLPGPVASQGLFDGQQKSTPNNTDDANALNDADQAISAQPWEFA
jgi:hypothetical protein